MSASRYRRAARNLDRLKLQLLAIDRKQVGGIREDLPQVLSGAATTHLLDRLDDASRDLTAAARILAAAATRAQETAARLEVAEALAAAPAQLSYDSPESDLP